MSAPDITYIKEKIVKLTGLLYPRARAFRMPFGSVFYRLHEALAVSESKLFHDSLLILDSAIADNPNFSEEDATQWERRLAIISAGSLVPLADRIAAINRKLSHPGTNRPRQSNVYIEKQLRAAGFDVHVYENRFPNGFGGYETRTPEEVLGSIPGSAFHRSSAHHGALYHGAGFNKQVVNYLEADKDAGFIIGANYRSTFFIAGATFSTYASVDAEREQEFRQLILLLKPAQTVAFLFVNYV